MAEKKKKQSGLPNRISKLENAMEQGMWLQGCAACEDKLQANVPKTLDSLMRAGLNIWMLTGDKVGTAKNIGLACSLLSAELTQLEITEPKVLDEQLRAIAPAHGVDPDSCEASALHALKDVLPGKRLSDLKSDIISERLEEKAAGNARPYADLVAEYPGLQLLEEKLDDALMQMQHQLAEQDAAHRLARCVPPPPRPRAPSPALTLRPRYADRLQRSLPPRPPSNRRRPARNLSASAPHRRPPRRRGGRPCKSR